MKPIFVLLAVAAMIQGCSTVGEPVACPLDGNGYGTCKSMQDAYAAVQAGETGKASIFENESHGGAQPSSGARRGGAPVYGYLGSYPEPDKATPVFQQPKVFRPWLAPYVDADGVLHSGEYAYFNTPGAWNYGELRKPGVGGAVMGPVKPWETGVLPATARVDGAKPAAGQFTKPAAPPEPAPPPGADAGQGPRTVDGITQPYQRLN